MRLRKLIVLFAVLAMIAAACGDDDAGDDTTTTAAPATTTTTAAPATTTTTEPAPEVGSPENPIQVLFVPSNVAQRQISGGEVMKQELEAATGYSFEVSIPTSYASTIEAMCASPANTMGFIPGLGYILANNLCDVDVAFKAVRFGWPVYWTQILVARDSDIDSIDDLDGLKWAYPDAGSTSGFMVPSLMFSDAGVTPGETISTGGSHTGAARAIYNGEVDFATTFFSPPLLGGDDTWEVGDPLDVPDELIPTCEIQRDGDHLRCGPDDDGDGLSDFRVLDARAGLRAEAPDVIEKVRILMISPPIPNDTLSFGPDFPADIRAEIEAALIAFAETEAWEESIGHPDFYDWTGIDTAVDSEYDDLRGVVATVGITLENIGD
jgi:phosphonate transport system substrate-binding protein